MAVVTATFTGFDTGTYSGSSFYATQHTTTGSVYLSDSSSTNGLINVNDDVSFYYNGTDFAAVYEGYYLSGGTEYPLVLYSGNYYLLGVNYNDTSPIVQASDTQVTCYVSGTRIRVLRKDAEVGVAVEDLAVGDLAVTSSGVHRPIRWLGHRKTDCRNHPRPREVMPVRIAAHAFGPDKPTRDLMVSPGHSICVHVIEAVLIPASVLVNGTTIQQIEVDELTYWHVELDSHDILLAENLPAESYIDMGNRGFFSEADVVGLQTLPDLAFPDTSLAVRTHADFCRPFHIDGPIVEVVRAQLRARGASLGWTLAHEPMADLHLIADGERIEPTIRGLTARFSVPAGAKNVWLASNTARPCEISDSIDVRDLGICVAALTIYDGFGASHAIALDDPLLCAGFHHVEEGVRRWTAGRAPLPSLLWQGCDDGFFLRAELALPALPRWVAPPVADAAFASTPLDRRANLHRVA